jgi:hypothetical protein
MIGGTIIMAVGTGLLSTFDVDTPTAIWISYQVIVGVGAGLNLQVLLLLFKSLRLDSVARSSDGCAHSGHPYSDYDTVVLPTPRMRHACCRVASSPVS